MPRCLVVHPGALGDVLLAGPALGHLRALGFRTTLAVAPRLVSLFRGCGLADDACDLEGLALHRLFVELPDADAHDVLARFDAIACWLGAGDSVFRANLARLGHRTIVARAAPPPGSGVHVSRHLVETLAPLGPLPAGLPPARLHATETDLATAGEWLAAQGIRPREAVVLQPGAGSASKVWPGFAALACQLRAAGHPLVALVGPADGPAIQALLEAGALEERQWARDWPLPEIAALLSLARTVVGNDSGPTHLAAAVGCPTVALFGPTDPTLWAPLGAHVRVVAGSSGNAPWADVDHVVATLRALLSEPGIDAPGALAGACRGGPVTEQWR